MSKKAFGWAADQAGCYFYRVAQPLETLSKVYNWDAEHGTKFNIMPTIRPTDPKLKYFAKKAAEQYDIVLTQRTCLPAPTMFWKAMAEVGAFLVYEIDDDLFSVDYRSNQRGHEFFNRPDIRKNLQDNIAIADHVTVSTPHLAEIVVALNPNVFVCPNAVPDWLLEYDRPVGDPGKLTIGWGGSATHWMDFEEVRKQLKQLFQRRTDIEFHTIGANYVQKAVPADRTRWTPWFPSIPDYYKAIDFDIGLAPLRPHIFNRSKSPIKVLEYAALGIPIVASDYGPYSSFVRHGETGFLVRREHEWNRYLRQLIEDDAMRAEMGANGRKLAAQYTNSAVAPLWREALSED